MCVLVPTVKSGFQLIAASRKLAPLKFRSVQFSRISIISCTEGVLDTQMSGECPVAFPFRFLALPPEVKHC
jgi:hypothetical protein